MNRTGATTSERHQAQMQTQTQALELDGIKSAGDLRQLLVDAHPGLSPQLQRIAQYVLDHPNQVAVSTIADLSAALDVQPSGFIRFSKAVGFKGFSEIQRIVKAELRVDAPPSYFDRLRTSANGSTQDLDTVGRFAALAEKSLANLPPQSQIDQAAQIMANARIIHIIGQRRAFGIASYLNYQLAQFQAGVNLLAFVGGMAEARTSFMAPGDCLVAMTFPNYTAGAIDVAKQAHDQGIPVIALTDSLVSPIAKFANLVLITDPGTESGFRSAVGSMVTAQAMAVTYGELKRNP